MPRAKKPKNSLVESYIKKVNLEQFHPADHVFAALCQAYAILKVNWGKVAEGESVEGTRTVENYIVTLKIPGIDNNQQENPQHTLEVLLTDRSPQTTRYPLRYLAFEELSKQLASGGYEGLCNIRTQEVLGSSSIPEYSALIQLDHLPKNVATELPPAILATINHRIRTIIKPNSKYLQGRVIEVGPGLDEYAQNVNTSEEAIKLALTALQTLRFTSFNNPYEKSFTTIAVRRSCENSLLQEPLNT